MLVVISSLFIKNLEHEELSSRQRNKYTEERHTGRWELTQTCFPSNSLISLLRASVFH
uniref:Uncharacterized protein n=1 Tax=Solanum tuberosum TaxID=4113 RepID=M1AB38_SOLTU